MCCLQHLLVGNDILGNLHRIPANLLAVYMSLISLQKIAKWILSEVLWDRIIGKRDRLKAFRPLQVLRLGLVMWSKLHIARVSQVVRAGFKKR